MEIKEIKKRIKKIKSYKNFKKSASRAMITVLSTIEDGTNPDDKKELFRLVQLAYLSGRHRRPSWIKKEFKNTYNFIMKELGFPSPQNNDEIWEERIDNAE